VWRVKTSSHPEPVKLVEGSLRPVADIGWIGDPETSPGFSSSTPMVCDDKSASAPAPKDDEELVDYNSSPKHMNFDINVVHMSMDGYFLSEEDIAHLDFGPMEAIFQMPQATENHVKAL
jgi:hypothetical protein